jgi:putative membrane protein insertion efficiency factor
MIRKILIGIIRFYQKVLSPMKGRATCIYYPTCSEYTASAIKIHGPILGILMGFYRILRCNPFSKGGYDPVPIEPIFKKKKKNSKGR